MKNKGIFNKHHNQIIEKVFPKVVAFGCNHKNMLGLVRSLGEKGIRPHCVLLNRKEGLVFSSKYPESCYWAETPEKGLSYIMETFSGEKEKPILLSSDDITETLFDKHATELREHFVVPAADEDGKLTYYMDKQHIGEYAAKFGFKTPVTRLFRNGDVIDADLKYPVFTKSVKSIDGSKHEERKCANIYELKNALQECKQGELLVQQYIEKKDEIDFIGYVANGHVYIPYIQHQLRFSDHAYGGYHKFDQIIDDDLVLRVKELLKGLKFQGLFSVEFLVDKDDEWYFTEVNFRHDGHAYLLTAAGCNIPYLYCCAVTGKGCGMPSIRKSFTGMNEPVDFEQFVKTRKIPLMKWVWQFMTVDTRILWNWKDNGPIWYMVKKTLLRK